MAATLIIVSVKTLNMRDGFMPLSATVVFSLFVLWVPAIFQTSCRR